MRSAAQSAVTERFDELASTASATDSDTNESQQEESVLKNETDSKDAAVIDGDEGSTAAVFSFNERYDPGKSTQIQYRISEVIFSNALTFLFLLHRVSIAVGSGSDVCSWLHYSSNPIC